MISLLYFTYDFPFISLEKFNTWRNDILVFRNNQKHTMAAGKVKWVNNIKGSAECSWIWTKKKWRIWYSCKVKKVWDTSSRTSWELLRTISSKVFPTTTLTSPWLCKICEQNLCLVITVLNLQSGWLVEVLKSSKIYYTRCTHFNWYGFWFVVG